MIKVVNAETTSYFIDHYQSLDWSLYVNDIPYEIGSSSGGQSVYNITIKYYDANNTLLKEETVNATESMRAGYYVFYI